VIKSFDRKEARGRRHRRVRAKVSGTALRPRLSIFRSNVHVYAQVIDDSTSRTLAAASTIELKTPARGVQAAQAVGKAIADRAVKAGVTSVVFDRGGFIYHGQVRALAEAAREAGLEF
jgi:large subunit ribosomal protein L18